MGQGEDVHIQARRLRGGPEVVNIGVVGVFMTKWRGKERGSSSR